jgi:hypothetical protein
MTAQILCPFCLSLATLAEWSGAVELLECSDPDCGKIWEAEHHMKLWAKYQLERGINHGQEKS